MAHGKNIPPEIEEALAQGRAEGLREAAEFVAKLRQRRVPWFFRGLGDVPETDAEGWGNMKGTELQILKETAASILRLIDGSAAPEHTHIWSSGDNPICAICGLDKQRSSFASPADNPSAK